MDGTSREDDLGYFLQYPAPMMEAMAKLSPSPFINSTTTHYGPFFYGFGRLVKAFNCLEIGIATGWSSGFLAWAVKENNISYNQNGVYIGEDLSDKSFLYDEVKKFGLPAKFHYGPSVKWLANQDVIKPESLDLVFVDGWHNTDYVRQEVELLYPLLKKNSYLILHDVYATCEAVFPMVVNNPNYKWEYIRFLASYGIGIFRKLDGEDQPSPKNTTTVLESETMRNDMFKLNPLPIDAERLDYGAFLYTLARAMSALGFVECLELDAGNGWVGGLLANAVNETITRYGDDSFYIGVTDQDVENTFGKRVQFIKHDDSIKWLEGLKEPRPVSLVCLRGDVNSPEKLRRQIELVYKMLKDNGFGYIVVYNMSEEMSQETISKYDVEHLKIGDHMLFRKMDNYDYDKVFWINGDEKSPAHWSVLE